MPKGSHCCRYNRNHWTDLHHGVGDMKLTVTHDIIDQTLTSGGTLAGCAMHGYLVWPA